MAAEFDKCTSLTELPAEILSLTIKNLEKRDLKTLRLSCKHLDPFVAPLLFAHVTLFPHARCMENAVFILQFEAVSQHVRHITYDYHWIHFIDDFQVNSFYDRPWAENFDSCYIENYSDGLTKSSEAATESWLLQQVLARTPRLETLEVIGAEADCDEEWTLHPPSYYEPLFQLLGQSRDEIRRELGHMYIVRGEDKITKIGGMNILLALGALTMPISFKVEYCSYESFFYNVPILGKSHLLRAYVLEKIQEFLFETHIDDRPGCIGGERLGAKRLGALVSRMPMLVSCGLDFRSLNDLCREDGMGFDRESDLAYFWPLNEEPKPFFASRQLRLLLLDDTRCYQSELHALLDEISKTLQHLYLYDLQLFPSEQTGKHPCLVQTIRYMQSHFQLLDVHLAGWFDNCGGQRWQIFEDDFADEDCLLKQTYRFILHGGKCPLDSEAISEGEIDVVNPGLSGIADRSFAIEPHAGQVQDSNLPMRRTGGRANRGKGRGNGGRGLDRIGPVRTMMTRSMTRAA